ncbi:MAG: hypothetical protein E6R06_07265 [Mycobacterium sp.]|jgi:prophage antirepressor-like protein|nr:MAG: hypothetical protein E6R06_07265 [Mycobacterium sp.]
MSADLKPFFYAGAAVRVMVINGSPWFILADLCRVLSIANSRHVAARLADDQKGVAQNDTPGGMQQVTIVSESGMYEVVIRSDKPEAMRFRRWITTEVLPAIRKTGSYSRYPAHPETATLPSKRELAQWVIDAEDRADREAAARAEAEQRAAALAAPAAAWDTLAEADGDYSVADAAKVLSRDPNITIGRDRLFEFMQAQRWVYRDHHDGHWRAYQTQVDTGRLAEKVGKPYRRADTEQKVLSDPTIRVTAKGLAELLKRLGGDQQLALVASA